MEFSFEFLYSFGPSHARSKGVTKFEAKFHACTIIFYVKLLNGARHVCGDVSQCFDLGHFKILYL